MNTLRRNLRNEFEEILKTLFNTAHLTDDSRDIILGSLADKAMDILLAKPKFDVQKAGLEWQIAMGAEIKQEDLDAEQLEKATIDAFESAFSIKGNWNWYPAKPQDERVWKKFRDFLVKIYTVDKDCFTKYVTWTIQPYVRGAMTGLQIKRNPQDFPDTWASFCMSTKYQPPRTSRPDSERDDLDANGIPMSY